VVSHKPWRQAPLQEAVFEIRFSPLEDYAIFVGGIAAALQGKFPKIDKLDAAELPPFVPIQGIVRHRFSEKSGSLIFQTGADVISVNAISYLGFEHFSKTVREVLTSAEVFVSTKEITRLGIRYINRFEDVTKISSVLNVKTPFSDMESSKTKEVLLRYLKQEAQDIAIATNISFISGDKALFLDLDAFYDSPTFGWDMSCILDWNSKAHDVVYDNFENLVSQKEKDLRQ
jgi:uncharacterized protein (TIGR04255 family)